MSFGWSLSLWGCFLEIRVFVYVCLCYSRSLIINLREAVGCEQVRCAAQYCYKCLPLVGPKYVIF